MRKPNGQVGRGIALGHSVFKLWDWKCILGILCLFLTPTIRMYLLPAVFALTESLLEILFDFPLLIEKEFQFPSFPEGTIQMLFWKSPLKRENCLCFLCFIFFLIKRNVDQPNHEHAFSVKAYEYSTY